MASSHRVTLNKVPQITLLFWVIKICATTLGETAGDALSMSAGLGYLLSTVLLFGLFLITLAAQIRAPRYNPALYWMVILATTTAGTTWSDFLDRTAQTGYLGGSAILIFCLAAILVAWRVSLGKISFDHVTDPKVEIFYWLTILISNTLGTALGDFVADDGGMGFHGAALIFGGAIAITLLLYLFTSVSRTALFWAAFVLTRPLGAALGDSLTKPVAAGGLSLDRFAASLLIAILVVVLIGLTARPAARPDLP